MVIGFGTQWLIPQHLRVGRKGKNSWPKTIEFLIQERNGWMWNLRRRKEHDYFWIR